MTKYDLKSWEEFIPIINEITKQYPEIRILYRGGNTDKDDTHLKTSLERFGDKSWTLKEYAKLIWRCAPQVEAYNSRQLNLPSWIEIEKELEDNFSDCLLTIPSSFYRYSIYLRQHGFPSPLLDWTTSPYIAAYFAFAENKGKEIERNTIFVYIERPYNIKTTCNGTGITTLGPEINTHKRHFIQKAWYTVAVTPKKQDWEFISHNTCFGEYFEGEEEAQQDVLIRITLPISERIKILSHLDQYNLNQFTLFQTEEALLKTIAFKEIEEHQL